MPAEVPDREFGTVANQHVALSRDQAILDGTGHRKDLIKSCTELVMTDEIAVLGVREVLQIDEETNAARRDQRCERGRESHVS